MFEYFVVFLVTFLVGFVTFLKWRFSYWNRKKVPSIEASIPFGSIGNPLRNTTSLGVLTKNFYDIFKASGYKHGGFYNLTSPTYIPVDPELIKCVMQKDFSHFVDRGTYHNVEDDPLSGHLFAIGGEKWRTLRTKLTPTFTTGKMKMMFDTVVQCSKPMKASMEQLTMEKLPVDIKEIAARFTTDVIGSCAFGLECNSFKEKDAEFRKYGKRIFQASKMETLKFLLLVSAPNVGRFFRMNFIPKEISDFFMNVVESNVKYRENNNVIRNDMLQLLIQMRNKQNNSEKQTLSMDEISAQAFVFFLAGFETSSTTMTFCLLELAKHPEIQEKVRMEINEVLNKYDDKITYDGLSEMKYLTQVIEETLRKYPPLTAVTRDCVKDYQVPNTDITIDKGTKVFIPILGLHNDPEFYPDPDKFDPERFSEENKKEIRPFTYIPFGEGPRLCIGLRFGMMQTKVGLTTLLRNYHFSLNNKTKLPIRINPFTFTHTALDAIWLDSEKVGIEEE